MNRAIRWIRLGTGLGVILGLLGLNQALALSCPGGVFAYLPAPEQTDVPTNAKIFVGDYSGGDGEIELRQNGVVVPTHLSVIFGESIRLLILEPTLDLLIQTEYEIVANRGTIGTFTTGTEALDEAPPTPQATFTNSTYRVSDFGTSIRADFEVSPRPENTILLSGVQGRLDFVADGLDGQMSGFHQNPQVSIGRFLCNSNDRAAEPGRDATVQFLSINIAGQKSEPSDPVRFTYSDNKVIDNVGIDESGCGGEGTETFAGFMVIFGVGRRLRRRRKK